MNKDFQFESYLIEDLYTFKNNLIFTSFPLQDSSISPTLLRIPSDQKGNNSNHIKSQQITAKKISELKHHHEKQDPAQKEIEEDEQHNSQDENLQVDDSENEIYENDDDQNDEYDEYDQENEKSIFHVIFDSNKLNFRNVSTNEDIFSAVTIKEHQATTFQIFDNNNSNPIATVSSDTNQTTFKTIFANSFEINNLKFNSNLIKDSPTRNFNIYIAKNGVNIKGTNEPQLHNFPDQVYRLHSKQPLVKKGIPILDFGPNIKEQSVRNFILISEDHPDEEIMLFGKVNKNLYYCEFCHPITNLNAFSIILPHFA